MKPNSVLFATTLRLVPYWRKFWPTAAERERMWHVRNAQWQADWFSERFIREANAAMRSALRAVRFLAILRRAMSGRRAYFMAIDLEPA